MIDYRFNTYMVSNDKAPIWTERAYKLVRCRNKIVTGQMAGDILYRYYVQNMTASQINTNYSFISIFNIKAMLRGTLLPEAYVIFMEMLEHEPEMLDNIFKL